MYGLGQNNNEGDTRLFALGGAVAGVGAGLYATKGKKTVTKVLVAGGLGFLGSLIGFNIGFGTEIKTGWE